MYFVVVSGYVDPLDPDIEIEVPDDDSGLYAIDILDPSWVSHKNNLLQKFKCHFGPLLE